jgi:uncharacterized protein YutE (UPF0331/DUF86 family)
MSPIGKNKILEKLSNLNEYIKYLDQIKKESKNEKMFLNDFYLFGNAERFLQLSIQSIIDIIHLIIVEKNLERPNDNYEAISILFSKKILSKKSATILNLMVGLRNILVHEYGKIDRKNIYLILTKNLDDIKRIKKEIISSIK